jgi:hypothetical protein
VTLTRYLLDVIDSEWPDGTLPDDVELVDANDSQVLSEPIRDRTASLQDANYIAVRHTQRDDTPGGVQAGNVREAVLRVQVEGLHEDEFGYIDDHDEFRTLVRNSKEAIRAVKNDPGVGDDHPAVWVKAMVGPETGGSSAHADYYQCVYDVTLRGHEP